MRTDAGPKISMNTVLLICVVVVLLQTNIVAAESNSSVISGKADIILAIDFSNSIVKVVNSNTTYPIIDGIIDFLPNFSDNISKAYDNIAHVYDDYLISSSISMRLINQLFWGFSNDLKYSNKLLSFIPDNFDSVLLDAPVGTGILTVDKYKAISNAHIITIDSSMEMLIKARSLFTSKGIDNVLFIRADISKLPIKDFSVDLFLTLNGFHSFSQKDIALFETNRVIRNGGNMIGCVYVRGKRKLSDFFVDKYLSKLGTFFPPFFSEEEIVNFFGQYYDFYYRETLHSFLYFDMVKKL